jgi:hypothetical protein
MVVIPCIAELDFSYYLAGNEENKQELIDRSSVATKALN